SRRTRTGRGRAARGARTRPTAKGAHRCGLPWRAWARSGLLAGADLRGPCLLARAGVPVQRAALDGLVDRGRQLPQLGVGGRVIALGDRGLEAAEVGANRRRVAPVLEALTLGAKDALLLRMNVGHELRPGMIAAAWGRMLGVTDTATKPRSGVARNTI